MSDEELARRDLARMTAKLAQANQLLARVAVDLSRALELKLTAAPSKVAANGAAGDLSPLQVAIVAAASIEEVPRKVLFKRAKIAGNSHAYAAVRELLRRGLLIVGIGGGIRLPAAGKSDGQE